MIKYHFARGNQGPQNPKDFDFVTANVKEQPVQEFHFLRAPTKKLRYI